MTGPATYARCADTAAVARDRLDRAAASAAAVEDAQRNLVADLLALWPTTAWIAAGAASAKRWLLAYTHCSEAEAHRLERIAGLCRSEEHTSELQSLMRISYAVFCLKKKKKPHETTP